MRSGLYASYLMIGGVRIDILTREDVLTKMDEAIEQGNRLRMATVNPEFVMQAQRDSDFKDVLAESEVAVADGVGILWSGLLMAYKPRLPGWGRWGEVVVAGLCLMGWVMISNRAKYKVFPDKISGSDFCVELAQWAAGRGHSLFLLGEQPGVAEEAASALKRMAPGLIIGGCFAGDGGVTGDAETVAQLQSKPSAIVLVAYGAPKQELWLRRNLSKTSSMVGIGVGGTFLFLAGRVKRAPVWMRQLGLEWLYRLWIEPWRWRRQLDLPRFVWLVIKERVESDT